VAVEFGISNPFDVTIVKTAKYSLAVFTIALQGFTYLVMIILCPSLEEGVTGPPQADRHRGNLGSPLDSCGR